MNQQQILDTLRTVIDPEIGVNIVDLGLVYKAAVEERRITIELTMTTPTCPLGEMILNEAHRLLRRTYPEAEAIDLDLVWDPPWSPDRMSAEARRQLGWAN